MDSVFIRTAESGASMTYYLTNSPTTKLYHFATLTTNANDTGIQIGGLPNDSTSRLSIYSFLFGKIVETLS